MSAPDPNTTTASAPSTDVAPERAEADVTTGLNDLLADATVFYQKVRHYHWNVTGPHFFTLHEEFETLYTFWNDAIDAIAEQVRSRGDRPVHTLADVLDLASPAGTCRRGPRFRTGNGGFLLFVWLLNHPTLHEHANSVPVASFHSRLPFTCGSIDFVVATRESGATSDLPIIRIQRRGRTPHGLPCAQC